MTRSSQSARRGVMLLTLLVALVVGIIGEGIALGYQLRQGAQHGVSRALAVKEAVSFAESALEEGSYRLRHATPGEELLRPGREIRFSLAPAETRAVIADAGLAGRVEVEDIAIAQVGSLTEKDDVPPEGTLEMRVRSVVRLPGRAGAPVARCAVRRYRFHVLRVSRFGHGKASRQPWIRMAAAPMAQWVTP